MPTSRLLLSLAGLLFHSALAAVAEDSAALFSGPQQGERVAPLRVRLVYGDDAGATVDVVEQSADKPSLLVVVNGANRPAAGLTRALMNFAEIHGEQMYAAVVYLDSDLSAAEKYMRQAISWWGVSQPVGVSIDGAEGPGSWGLNRNVNLTILVIEKNRVLANFALVQPSLTDGPKILTELNRLVDFRIPTDPEMAFLSIPTRKPASATWQPAPADVHLRQLICDALAADDDAAAQAAAAVVDDYVGEDQQRQAVLGRAASAMLHRNNYTRARDIPIVIYLRQWRDEFGNEDTRRRRQQN